MRGAVKEGAELEKVGAACKLTQPTSRQVLIETSRWRILLRSMITLTAEGRGPPTSCRHITDPAAKGVCLFREAT